MNRVTITLPMPPSANNLYRGFGEKRHRAPNYSAWFDEAGWRVNEARAKGACTALPRDVWYWTDVCLPLNHIGDADNRLKALHDLLHTMGVTPDDRWLFGGTFRRCSDVVAGTCRAEITSLDPDPAVAERRITEIAAAVLAPADDWQAVGDIAARMVRGYVA